MADEVKCEFDIRSLLYVSLNENLVCPICCCALVDPCYTKCGHTFCSVCLYKALAQSPKCPVDRNQLAEDDISPAPKILLNMVNELLVYCPNADKGCKAINQRCLLQHHLRDQCVYTKIKCPSATCSELIEKRYIEEEPDKCFHEPIACNACDEQVPRFEMEVHKRTCSARTIRCPDCLEEFTMSALQDHLGICSDSVLLCPATKFGCRWSGRRDKLSSHTLNCTFASLAPFLEKQEEKIQNLELENRGLRTQLVVGGPSAVSDSDVFHIFTEHERFRTDLEHVSEQLSELEIRQSVLLMNQNVRTKEELQTIRNAVNGIRHQIHFLLMERRTWALQNFASSTILPPAAGAAQLAPKGETSTARPQRRESETFRQDVKL
ncbi:hypothetical protein V1512DRAFT_226893 [Lipomyces arxii]|uniref:uncharacterized protein n=1 Tax=Lipomyces arxii TaxID=56418 RepID=UPI0034CF3E48